MKNDLTCGVVRDLLPSYVEGLLSVESKEAVEKHLEVCPGCTAQKEAMSAQAKETALEVVKEVDYLKRVKKTSWKRVVLAAVVTAVLVLGALGLKVFVIGTPIQPQSVAVTAAETYDGDVLRVSVASMSSGNAFHGWKVEEKDGVASIYARNVLVSPLYSDGSGMVNVSLEDVREVWLGGTSGQLLWKEGLVISSKTLDLLEAQTPYCGDAAALGRIASLLDIEQYMGPFSHSLQTSSEPYIWDLEFKDRLEDGKVRYFRVYAYQMLALVGNLDKVSCTYRPAGYFRVTPAPQTDSVSAESATKFMARLTERHNGRYDTDWPVHESIKEYAQSPLEFQRMKTLLYEYFD